jgi:nitroreductase
MKKHQKDRPMEVFETIFTRRSIRNFTGKPIPKEDLKKIVDAGRLAPSATNRQMWDFIVITREEILNDILHHFHAGRKYETYEDGKFDDASAIIAVVMDEANEFWREDGSAAAENILLSARALEYGSCWIEGQIRSHEEHFKELLGLPEKKRILLMIALGEPVKWSPPPPKKSLSEVLHWEKYKEP